MASVDDVHNLLNAVNRQTLKRMEDKSDQEFQGLRAHMVQLHERLEKISRKLGIPETGPPPTS